MLEQGNNRVHFVRGKLSLAPVLSVLALALVLLAGRVIFDGKRVDEAGMTHRFLVYADQVDGRCYYQIQHWIKRPSDNRRVDKWGDGFFAQDLDSDCFNLDQFADYLGRILRKEVELVGLLVTGVALPCLLLLWRAIKARRHTDPY